MDGKYAYRENPRVQMRVLCVDRKSEYPVVALNLGNGGVSAHTVNGSRWIDETNGSDLVPLDETLTVTPGIYRTRDLTLATICYIRKNAPAGYVAVGWYEGAGTGVDSWRLNGAFSRQDHGLDLVERVGDLP